MKTQIFCLFLAISMAIVSDASAQGKKQSKQQGRALARITNERASLEKELAGLETAIATYVAVDTIPTFSRKKEIDMALASGEMSIGQRAAYRDQSQKLGQRLHLMRQQLLIGNANLKADKIRANAIKTRLQDLDVSKTTLVDVQLDEAINQKIPQEMTRNEAKRRHLSNGVESEDIQIQRQWLGIEKLASIPVKADQTKGYLGMVTWNIAPGRDTTQMITFIMYDKGKKFDGISISCRAGQMVEAYLLPGEYVCEAWFGGIKLGQREFPVGPEIQQWGEHPYHWYNYYNKKIVSRPDYL